ncbi:hypothetical protein Plhal304r1_c012g0047381 [Plasmopara halstedii]
MSMTKNSYCHNDGRPNSRGLAFTLFILMKNLVPLKMRSTTLCHEMKAIGAMSFSDIGEEVRYCPAATRLLLMLRL